MSVHGRGRHSIVGRSAVSIAPPTAGDAHHRYCVYGVEIVSDRPLAMPQHAHDSVCRVECVTAGRSEVITARAAAAFDSSSDTWHQSAELPDGSTYARWQGVGEFLVAADGRRIACCPDEHASAESVQVYLLGQALACALVKQAFEPLHATAIVVDGGAVAFLGGCGFGKSTLAAAFLDAGYPLLTDDLLVLRESPDAVVAYPGPPRLKLFPAIARRVLGRAADGVAMNPDTAKLIVPLDASLGCHAPVPIRAVYALAPPRDGCRRETVSIEPASARDGFLALIAHAFNRRATGAARTVRQFSTLTRLAGRLSIRRLVYPRTLNSLPEVRDAVLEDLDRDRSIAQPVPAAVPCHLE